MLAEEPGAFQPWLAQADERRLGEAPGAALRRGPTARHEVGDKRGQRLTRFALYRRCATTSSSCRWPSANIASYRSSFDAKYTKRWLPKTNSFAEIP